MAEEALMRWARWRPMAEIVCEVSELSPPRESKSNGMKEMLAEAQGAWWRFLFCDYPTCNAYPGVDRGSPLDGKTLEWADDSDVQGGWTTTVQVGEKNVGRMGLAIRNKVRWLSSGREGSCLGCCKNCIPNGVMMIDPIPIAATSHMMVSKTVSGRMTDWAHRVCWEEREAQPITKTRPEFLIKHM